MIVMISKFVVANQMEEAVKEAFLKRPHMVDNHPGFVRMEVLRPADAPSEFWLMTYWTDRASFQAWHSTHLYRDAHAGIPKGLRLDPKSTEIREFEHIAS